MPRMVCEGIRLCACSAYKSFTCLCFGCALRCATCGMSLCHCGMSRFAVLSVACTRKQKNRTRCACTTIFHPAPPLHAASYLAYSPHPGTTYHNADLDVLYDPDLSSFGNFLRPLSCLDFLYADMLICIYVCKYICMCRYVDISMLESVCFLFVCLPGYYSVCLFFVSLFVYFSGNEHAIRCALISFPSLIRSKGRRRSLKLKRQGCGFQQCLLERPIPSGFVSCPYVQLGGLHACGFCRIGLT